MYGSLSFPPHTLRVSSLPRLLFPSAAIASVFGVGLKSVFPFCSHSAPTPHPPTCTHTPWLTRCVQVPDLAALPPACALAGAVFKDPRNISLARDGSVLVADWAAGVPAMQVWPDGTQPSQQLPPATANATAVLAIDGEVASGLIVLACGENRVERTGRTVWKRTDMKGPYAAVVAGDAVLVTENSAARVARLDMGSGATRGTFGEGTLKNPRGIAIGAGGEIVVADNGTQQVHVFDVQGRPLRSLGQGRLQYTRGVCVDGLGRVYVADGTACAIVVLDGASGAVLATIAVEGNARGVAVTRRGQIVASVYGGKSLFVIGSCQPARTPAGSVGAAVQTAAVKEVRGNLCCRAHFKSVMVWCCC
jgi:DNA-binding beta-propeller fold protein YncE